MITTVDAQTFRNKLGDMINQAQLRRDDIVITRNSARVAALINVTVFDNMHQMQADLTTAGEKIARRFQDIEEKQGIEALKAIAAQFYP